MVKLYRDDKIFNPETGRYVKLTGTIGRRLERMSDEQYNNLGGGAGAGAGADEGGVKIFNVDRTKIKNPKSNRFVNVSSTLGRKLLRMSNDEYLNLRTPGKPTKPGKPRVDLKQVIREEQAKAIVRGVRKGDEYARRIQEQQEQEVGAEEEKEAPAPAPAVLPAEVRERIEDVIEENPALVIIPPTRNIRDIARQLAARRPPVQRRRTAREMIELERADTIEERYREPRPLLERDTTEEVMPSRRGLTRERTEEEKYKEPRPLLERELTEEVTPAEPRGDIEEDEKTEEYIQPEEREYYDSFIQAAEEIESIADDVGVEETKEVDVGVEETKEVDVAVEEAVFEAIRNERETLLSEIEESLESEGGFEDITDILESEQINNLEDNITEEIRRQRMEMLNNLYQNAKAQAREDEEFEEEKWDGIMDDLYGLEPVEDDTQKYKKKYDKFTLKMLNMLENTLWDYDEKEDDITSEEAIEDAGLRLLNLDINSGRGAYQAHTSNPSPHVDAFQHIEESKK